MRTRASDGKPRYASRQVGAEPTAFPDTLSLTLKEEKMKSVYEVCFKHKHYTDTFEPFVIARNIDEAKRKAQKWLVHTQKAKLRNFEISSIISKGTIDIE